MSPHFFHSAVDHVSMSVLGSPVLIYIDDCCGHKIDAAAFEVIEELLAAMFKSCKFVIEASDMGSRLLMWSVRLMKPCLKVDYVEALYAERMRSSLLLLLQSMLSPKQH